MIGWQAKLTEVVCWTGAVYVNRSVVSSGPSTTFMTLYQTIGRSDLVDSVLSVLQCNLCNLSLQCFDTVGWATGRAPACKSFGVVLMMVTI